MAKKRVIDDEFAKKIVLIAKEKFGDQKQLAKAIGLTPSTISDWVNGRALPSLTVLKDLCIKAEISLDWLVLGKGFEEESLDINLFNEVFALAYTFAGEKDIVIDGSYFIAAYDFVSSKLKENKENNKKESIKKIFEKFKPLVLTLRHNKS